MCWDTFHNLRQPSMSAHTVARGHKLTVRSVSQAVKLFCLGAVLLPTAVACRPTDGSASSRWGRYLAGGSFIGGHPAMSPDGDSIVYASPRSGNGDIYKFSRTTKRTVRLTASAEYEGDPQFSPDGTKIAFVR